MGNAGIKGQQGTRGLEKRPAHSLQRDSSQTALQQRYHDSPNRPCRGPAWPSLAHSRPGFTWASLNSPSVPAVWLLVNPSSSSSIAGRIIFQPPRIARLGPQTPYTRYPTTNWSSLVNCCGRCRAPAATSPVTHTYLGIQCSVASASIFCSFHHHSSVSHCCSSSVQHCTELASPRYRFILFGPRFPAFAVQFRPHPLFAAHHPTE